MYTYFIVETGKYSHKFENVLTCEKEARLISAINRCETYVVDNNTAEVLGIYLEGLKME